jgi:hypothetical protein
MKKGSTLQYQWPSIPNVVSIATTELIKNILIQNPEVDVSEKLDGTNICISSKGWVATRRKIIIEDFYCDDQVQIRLNNSSLNKLIDYREEIRMVKGKLQQLLLDYIIQQTLVYGEWVQHRTSSTQLDKYCYEERKFLDGGFYAFGLSIIFENDLNEHELVKIQDTLINEIGDRVIEKPKPNIIIYGLGHKLRQFFRDCGIVTAQVFVHHDIRVLLNEPSLMDFLYKREREGFVFVGRGLILKLKPSDKPDKAHYIRAISELREKVNKVLLSTNEAEEIKLIIDSLERVSLSEPTKSYQRLLFENFLHEAETKFQRIEDLLDESMTSEEKENIREKHQANLTCEIDSYIVKHDYRLNDVHRAELDIFIKVALRRKIRNWFEKLRWKNRMNKTVLVANEAEEIEDGWEIA